jgi:hypothetical protein
MNTSAGCQLLGGWRSIEADTWDHDYLDLVQPAHLSLTRTVAENSPSAPCSRRAMWWLFRSHTGVAVALSDAQGDAWRDRASERSSGAK